MPKNTNTKQSTKGSNINIEPQSLLYSSFPFFRENLCWLLHIVASLSWILNSSFCLFCENTWIWHGIFQLSPLLGEPVDGWLICDTYFIKFIQKANLGYAYFPLVVLPIYPSAVVIPLWALILVCCFEIPGYKVSSSVNNGIFSLIGVDNTLPAIALQSLLLFVVWRQLETRQILLNLNFPMKWRFFSTNTSGYKGDIKFTIGGAASMWF